MSDETISQHTLRLDHAEITSQLPGAGKHFVTQLVTI